MESSDAGPVNCIRSFGDVIHLEPTPDPFVFLKDSLSNRQLYF
jgi:hypothetical protein